MPSLPGTRSPSPPPRSGRCTARSTLDGRAVAVKVQYPGIAETIAADLRNVALLRRMLCITTPAQDVDALIAEQPLRP